ncbi:MAG: hypothetical protein BMS9Abin02_1719 [Anaerolineae bacterium]|nr:MAG: hypothetical protein BMS9Abin02_1719 [Anaerolineae bacterium]
MSPLSKYVSWQNRRGEPIYTDKFTVTPESQSLIFQVPYFHFSWNRPVAVYVDDGKVEKRVRVRDLTRIIQLGIVSAGIVTLTAVWLMGKGR